METKTRITPLMVVAGFVSLTETVLGYAVTKTDGFAQVALTLFVIGFAFLVAAAFFYILWHRPQVFYSPAEYGGPVDPKTYIDAISKSLSPKVLEQIAPGDKSTQYELIDSLVNDVPLKQHLILMHLKNLEIPYAEYGHGHKYAYGIKDRGWGAGLFSPSDFVRKLKGSELVEIVEHAGRKIKLTEEGEKFAQWLMDNKRQADFLETSLGGWGTFFPPPLAQATEAKEVVGTAETGTKGTSPAKTGE